MQTSTLQKGILDSNFKEHFAMFIKIEHARKYLESMT